MRLSHDQFKNPYLWAYAAAILFHLLLLILQRPLGQAFFTSLPSCELPALPPLIFEFVEVPDTQTEEKTPEQTPLLADRNQVSQDQQTESLAENHLAFSDGIARAKEVLDTSDGKRHGDAFPHGQNGEQSQTEVERDREVDPEFSFVDVLLKDPARAQQERQRAVLGRAALPQQRVQMNNQQTRALERGGLQLSTYAWNFAPYLSYLKQHIGAHIFPPRAFDLGLLEGNTKVWFRIWRDGRLDGPEMIEFEGSPMLRDTSVKAVELSAQFKPLPLDFPFDYLEIVGTFEYLILKNGRGR
jgi:hypothetical protein